MRRATLIEDGMTYVEDISIHALREEGDLSINVDDRLLHEFLSTLSVRRATAELFMSGYLEMISIHALREEGDTVWMSTK